MDTYIFNVLNENYRHETPAKLEEYIIKYVFPADVGLSNNIVKPGDLCHVDARLVVSYFEGLEVPIYYKKLAILKY